MAWPIILAHAPAVHGHHRPLRRAAPRDARPDAQGLRGRPDRHGHHRLRLPHRPEHQRPAAAGDPLRRRHHGRPVVPRRRQGHRRHHRTRGRRPRRDPPVRYRPGSTDGKVAIAADAPQEELQAVLDRVRLAKGLVTPRQLQISEQGTEAARSCSRSARPARSAATARSWTSSSASPAPTRPSSTSTSEARRRERPPAAPAGHGRAGPLPAARRIRSRGPDRPQPVSRTRLERASTASRTRSGLLTRHGPLQSQRNVR